MFATWLIVIAWICLIGAFVCCALITIDVLRNRQHMMVMNFVWPITALYAGPLALWGYFRFGRLSTRRMIMQARQRGAENPGMKKPAPAIYAIATTHCGSGCALGDIIAEWSIYYFPVILTSLGLRTLWNHKIFSAWVLDYVLAFVLGIAFQYFTIVPMRHLSPGKDIRQALKADSLSLTAWQLGMYGWMAIATFLLFGHEIGCVTHSAV